MVHDKVTPFECDQCTRKFGLKRTLLSHKQIVHSKVSCDVCGQEIYNSFELKRHKAAVHGIIPADAFHCENWCKQAMPIKHTNQILLIPTLILVVAQHKCQ